MKQRFECNEDGYFQMVDGRNREERRTPGIEKTGETVWGIWSALQVRPLGSYDAWTIVGLANRIVMYTTLRGYQTMGLPANWTI